MNLSYNDFLVLRALVEKYENITVSQRDLEVACGISLGSVNASIKALKDAGFIDEDTHATALGIEALSPFKVNNAIIMAAGMSSRFAPLSYENPKGLLKVRDEVLIERQIKQLHAVGIHDITLVLGYMKEKFFYLEDLYNVKIVINVDYYRYNNTSTLIRVLDRLSNTYICSSDNYFVENVFHTYEYEAYYPVIQHEKGEQGEYYVTIGSNRRITHIEIGEGTLCMMGHVYFNQQFSKDFSALLEASYEDDFVKHNLWERLLKDNLDSLVMTAKLYPDGIIEEFDSLIELQAFDSYYLNNTDSKIFKNIIEVLGCSMCDIKEVEAIKEGMTNLSFRFVVKGKKYIYRHPGVGTDTYINREAEALAQTVAKKEHFDDSFIYMNNDEGWKISYFIDNASTLDYHNPAQVEGALKSIKSLHDLKIKEGIPFGIWNKTVEFVNAISERGRADFEGFDQLFDDMKRLFDLTEKDHVDKVLCHCDFYDPNIMFKEDKCYLIDWEYAGLDDPASDLGTFIACSDYTVEEAFAVLNQYYEKEMPLDVKRHYVAYIALAAYYWFVWAIFQESNGAAVGEYLYIWYKNSKIYGKMALEMYEERS